MKSLVFKVVASPLLIPAASVRRGLYAARLPAARAKLASIDDAMVLVTGRGERGRAGNSSVAHFAIEEVADRAAFVARGERELDRITTQPTVDRPLEMG